MMTAFKNLKQITINLNLLTKKTISQYTRQQNNNECQLHTSIITYKL